jgi:hypothetical protein
VLSDDLAELLGGNALYVVKRLVILDIYGTGGRDGRRGFADETTGFTEGTGGRYRGSRSEDRGEKVVAFGGFDFGFRFRLLHAARYLVSRTIWRRDIGRKIVALINVAVGGI